MVFVSQLRSRLGSEPPKRKCFFGDQSLQGARSLGQFELRLDQRGLVAHRAIR